MNGESDASGCMACQRRSDPARESEGVDGTGGIGGVVNSGSEGGIDVKGEEDDVDDEVS